MTISDIGTQISQKAILSFLRTQVNDVQRQVNTGKKSTTIAEMGPSGASNAILYRSKSRLLDVYTENLNKSKTQLKVMDQSLTSIADAGRNTLQFLRAQLQGTPPQGTIVSDRARNDLNEVIQKLNTEIGGRYVFAGDDLYNRPYQDVAALDGEFSTLTAGWLATPTTPADIITYAQGVTNTDLGYGTGVLTSSMTTIRIGDDLSIDSSIRAYEGGFADVVRGLAMISNLPQPTTPAEQENYWSVVNAAIETLDSGTKQIDIYQGTLGNSAKLVDDMIVEHRETQSVFETFIGEVEDVDMAEASVLFQSLQFQLEASYNMISATRNLSLVNFL